MWKIILVCVHVNQVPQVSFVCVINYLTKESYHEYVYIFFLFIIKLKLYLIFQVIHYWVVSQCNIATVITNAKQGQYATTESVAPCARQIENVSMDNYVFKVYVNQHAMATLLALTSNTV